LNALSMAMNLQAQAVFAIMADRFLPETAPEGLILSRSVQNPYARQILASLSSKHSQN
jgi:hypothetical protein